jgi:hypothetical protein
MHCHLIQSGELQAIVGDDSRDGIGGRQYAGLWSLTSKHRPFNAFGNSFAGLLPGEIRGKGPKLIDASDTSATLERSADAAFPTDCRATYRVVAPHYIDHTLTLCDRRSRVNANGYREVTWCCYMNSPEDPRVFFRSGGEWVGYIPPAHGVGSNIAPSYVPDAALETLPKQNEQRRPFWLDRINRRFDAPYYHGRIGNMVMMLLFDAPRSLRFFLSPDGGGVSLLPGKSCPAWDFMWVIPERDYVVNREYTFRVRLVYKPYVSDDDTIAEYERAASELKFARIT